MLPIIIRLTTDYSVDWNYPEKQRCPKCGGKVYHVKEDDYTVYCTSIWCNWHDETKCRKGIDFQVLMHQRICAEFEEAYKFGGCIRLKENRKYPLCKNPVIIMDDVLGYRYIIRELDFEEYHVHGVYNKESQPIVTYRTLDEMVKDGWKPD